ncbi:unnamed protein product [Durusdinium trenchii]|uniref:Kinesin-like protein KIF6 n=2 Tax=Durusdinium trenchii TaxID=1381693 RepID=A0ABP0LN56_9DINO
MMTADDRASAAEKGEVQPVQGTPIGVPQMGAIEAIVVSVAALSTEEQVVLNYRTAVMCFATLDILSTLLNMVAGLVSTRWGLLWCLLAIFLVGPLSGLLGAKHLNRKLVSVYLGFCFLKAGVEIALAIYTLWLWNIIFAILQVWIIKIVVSFWTALGQIPEQRRSELLDLKEAVQMVYW